MPARTTGLAPTVTPVIAYERTADVTLPHGISGTYFSSATAQKLGEKLVREGNVGPEVFTLADIVREATAAVAN